jgi:flagellar basal-body rod protein FlgG
MTGGLHVVGRAMSAFAGRHDVIANNLANVSTPGFARQDTFLERLAGTGPFDAPEIRSRTDFTPGPPVLTGNRLDLSLEGSGFFTVLTPGGERFSRLGSLTVDDAGLLTTSGGSPVLGENGLLQVSEGLVTVEKDGAVFVDGQFLDRLRLTTFASGADVERQAGGLYAPRPGSSADRTMLRPTVHTGQVEGSSVEPVAELVEMIQAMRAYEASSAALRSTNTTLDRAVNDIARV